MPQMEQISYADSFAAPNDANLSKSHQLLSSDIKSNSRKSPPMFPFQKQRWSNIPSHGSQIDATAFSVGDENHSLISRGVVGVAGLANAQVINI